MAGNKMADEIANKLEVIHLGEDLYIGKGTHRKCYCHPRNKEICIKIKVSNSHPRRDQNVREYKYYKILENRKVDWAHAAKCLGWVDTNLGRGLMFEHICDSDGNSLPNVKAILNSSKVSETEICYELQYIKNWIFEYGVIVADLKLENMIYDRSRPRGKRIVIIDGISNRNAITVASYIKLLATYKMRKVWGRLVDRENISCLK
jgi:hypothetical protein